MGEWAGRNAEQALAQLQSFLSSPAETDREKAGVIQAFEFTFEACWKLFQNLARGEGLDAPTPKKALGSALKMGLIANESLWLKMLEARNLTSHLYRRDLAEDVFADVRDLFAPALGAAIGLAKNAQKAPR